MLVTVVSVVSKGKAGSEGISGGFGDWAAGVRMVSGERSEVCGCIREGKLWGGLKD